VIPCFGANFGGNKKLKNDGFTNEKYAQKKIFLLEIYR
jgi:hypothetical protein